MGGTLFTTSDGAILTDLSGGIMTLDFLNGIITKPDGTTAAMNTSLQTMSLQKANSFMIFCSDADKVIKVGNALTIADHTLTTTIHNYAFDQIQITIPSNSTPDASNAVAFMASEDQYLNYNPTDNWHDRGRIPLSTASPAYKTSTNSATDYYQKHVGGYEDFYITTYNTDSSNSIDLQIFYSEDGVTFFADDGYTSAVTIIAGSYNSFATDRKHHFYKAQVSSTVTDSHGQFVIFYNNVSVF